MDTLPEIKTQNAYYYPNTIEGRLESYMLKNNIHLLGNPKWRESLTIQKGEFNGDVRYSGLDMNSEQRCYRTIDVKKLTLNHLERIHSYEQKYCKFFITGPGLWRLILGVDSDEIPDQRHLKSNQVEAIIKFNNDHRPICSKFNGFIVPPYFIYDCSFDGMNYHHAWDKTVWYAQFAMPMAEDGRVSRQFI